MRFHVFRPGAKGEEFGLLVLGEGRALTACRHSEDTPGREICILRALAWLGQNS